MKYKNERCSTSWSFDESRIYIDDETADERMLEIIFSNNLKKLSKTQKLKLLSKLIKFLTP